MPRRCLTEKGNGIFSTVILDWIEWEGPIVTPQEKSLRKGIFPENNATIEQVSHHLQSFAERAWRRKVDPQELSGYLQSYQKDMEAGDKIQDAFRTALLRVLTSRNFIYLVEGRTANKGTTERTRTCLATLLLPLELHA